MILSEMDFTLSSYKQLILTLQDQGYLFKTFEGFIQNPNEKALILRHDVDRLPENALTMARIEKDAGVKASYYFRTVPESFKPEIIKEIADLGHEIGYHYENFSAVHSRQYFRKLKIKNSKLRIDVYSEAIRDFEWNLEKLRKLYPVKTICMHGSPLSRYDNKKLWEKYDYRDYGIIAEPYFDIDFDEVFYLSDTGRRWDGDAVSVRDKVIRTEVRSQESEVRRPGSGGGDLKIRRTKDIIEAVEKGLLPDKIMMNVHPQRWTNDYVPWMRELVGQNFKNIVKKSLIKFRDLGIQELRD